MSELRMGGEEEGFVHEKTPLNRVDGNTSGSKNAPKSSLTDCANMSQTGAGTSKMASPAARAAAESMSCWRGGGEFDNSKIDRGVVGVVSPPSIQPISEADNCECTPTFVCGAAILRSVFFVSRSMSFMRPSSRGVKSVMHPLVSSFYTIFFLFFSRASIRCVMI